MAKKSPIVWLREPAPPDYPAALSFLTLVFAPKQAKALVKKLRNTKETSKFKARDILRASGLPLLAASDSHVSKDRRKIAARAPLSPLLLVRALDGERVIIADGYHRLCAVYAVDEDAEIPCRIT
ncbi:MAG: hypothetical protein ACXWG1_02685 [Usitatibacter sp.]